MTPCHLTASQALRPPRATLPPLRAIGRVAGRAAGLPTMLIIANADIHAPAPSGNSSLASSAANRGSGRSGSNPGSPV